ncbi:hypothetical protein OHA72_24165 [Dactylosporangium sp. NBC_01737]|uniref:hypothetical protein n=1 Tax=Dactylosporangium sp. NBC_01737 TaxID=2975959 RepID=UPI002E0DBD42|nr:hypothetical protein OHA72_24165 [Dactylosporangium sp. NBC_01737]
MKRLLVLFAAVAVAALIIGPALARRGPVYRLACPESVTAYGQMPRPAVPVVGGAYVAEVGDRFAVGGHRDPMPEGRPRLGGDATVVRYDHAETSPTGQRCGRVVAGYRYHVYVAEHAGDVVIDGHQVRISDRP